MENTSESLQVQLKEQIQFYFSSVNLLTDFQLQKTIKNSKNYWLPFSYLLNCNKVRQILKRLNVDVKHRKKYLYKLLEHSPALKVRKYRVKSKLKFNNERERKKIIYIQFQSSSPLTQLQKQLKEMQKELNIQINLKKGDKWIFLVIQNNEKKEQLERYLRIKGTDFNISKILNGQQWGQKLLSYQKLIQKIKRLKKEEDTKIDAKRMDQI